MFIIFFIFLFLNMPVGFSLLCSSVIFMTYNGISLISFVQRAIAGPFSFTLLAIGFFVFAGKVMNIGGITEKLFNFANILVGWLWGGLANANVVASMIFAGMSGSALADIGGLGQIEIKAMIDNGFDEYFAIGITGASSTIGPIIPPSIAAVIYAYITGVSTGKLFAAGLIPGIIMGLSMIIYVSSVSKINNYPKRNFPTIKEVIKSFSEAFFPILTPVIILGGIFTGVVTPTEASVVAAVYAICVSLFSRKLKYKEFLQIIDETVLTVVMIIFIIGCAKGFSYNIALYQLPQKLVVAFTSAELSSIAILFIMILVLLFVGCFINGTSALIILTPVMFPIITKAGIDPVHFGIVMIMSLMIGIITPPFGMALFMLSGMRKKPFEKVVVCFFPYLIILIIALCLIALVPSFTTFLPNILFG